MRLEEAYAVLSLPLCAPLDKVKKKYKDLAKIYHPDINKDPGAELKFKTITEAYDCIKAGKGNEPGSQKPPPNSWGEGVEDYVNNKSKQPQQPQQPNQPHQPHRPQQHKIRQDQDISLKTTISFKESVLGCQKEFIYNRKIKCHLCNGVGTACVKCSTNGFLEANTTVSVNIPAGISNPYTFILENMGNYLGSITNATDITDMYTHTNIFIEVIDNNGMIIAGTDVVSEIDISLLEALQGSSKVVNTIDGDKTIEINYKSKNRDEVFIPNLGVNKSGNHRIILNIQYPENIDQLVEYLKSEDLKNEPK